METLRRNCEEKEKMIPSQPESQREQLTVQLQQVGVSHPPPLKKMFDRFITSLITKAYTSLRHSAAFSLSKCLIGW